MRAHRIEIDVERGGVGLIRVRDDGVRHGAEELPLALARHATSKIASLEDLEAVTHARLSRRGAALDRLGLASAPRVAHGAGGSMAPRAQRRWRRASSAVRPAAHPRGTTIEVRELFFNVPARRKFVKSDATEFGHIVRLVERLALSRFDVSFRLRHGDGACSMHVPAAQRRRCRARPPGSARRRILPRGGGACDTPQARVSSPAGWGCRRASRAQPDQQFWFVNGRSVRDRLLMNAVRLAYRDVLYHGRHAAYVLYLTLDPRLVDVNAHPGQARGALPRQPPDSRLRVPRARAGARRTPARGGRQRRAPAHTHLATRSPGQRAAGLRRAGSRCRTRGRWRRRLPRPGARSTGRPRSACGRGPASARRSAQLHGIYILAAEPRGAHPRRHACRARAGAVREVEGRAAAARHRLAASARAGRRRA